MPEREGSDGRLRPALVVHWREHVEAALAAAADSERHLILVSTPGAGASLGPLMWRAMLRQAAALYPKARFTAYLDCADEAGTALRALRAGVSHVRFTGEADVAQQLSAIAGQLEASITGEDFERFDLLDQPDPFAACRAWLWRRNAAHGRD